MMSKPVLRRQFGCDKIMDSTMKMNRHLDLDHISNLDVRNTTRLLLTQKYRHPRARQLAAAARYGWYISPEQAYRPELLFHQ